MHGSGLGIRLRSDLDRLVWILAPVRAALGSVGRVLSPLSRWLGSQTPTLTPLAGRLVRHLRATAIRLGHEYARILRAAPRAALALARAIPARLRAAPITFALVLIILGIYRVTEWSGGDEGVEEMFRAASIVVVELADGEWWRLLTSNFVHLDWPHVAGNSKYLMIFGLLLEPAIGSRAFATLLVTSALGSGLASLVYPGSSAGASGMAYALNGALLVCPSFAAAVPSKVVWFWAAYCAGLGLQDSDEISLNYAGHIGGLLTGILVGSLLRRAPVPPLFTSRRRRLVMASVGSIAIVLVVAPDPQWSVDYQANRARLDLRSGRIEAATCRLDEIERLANPRRPVEAHMLMRSSAVRLMLGDSTGARSVLTGIHPRNLDSSGHRNLGVLQGWHHPTDPRGAERNLRKSLEIERAPETLGWLALLALGTDDSTLYKPRKALHYARYAVLQDSAQTPYYLGTLAWTQFACGRRGAAIESMRRAIALAPPDWADYLSELNTIKRATHEPAPPWTTMEQRDRWMAVQDSLDTI